MERAARVLCILVVLWAASSLLAQGGTEVPRVEVDPNAIQKPTRPMAITVHGIPEGQTVWLEVLQDCDGDDQPERNVAGCDSPLRGWKSPPAGTGGVVSTRLEVDDLKLLPRNRGLWLRAARDAQTRPAGQAKFGVMDNPCGLWRTAVQAFFGGVCDPNLSQALRRHRGGDVDLRDLTFEVRRLAVPAAPETALEEPVAVPNTRGASGVAWLDARTLLVTVTTPAQGEASHPPGLYRVSLGGKAELLWATKEGDALLPTAPRALPDDRVAFVRQRLIGEPAANEPAATLNVWRRGELARTIDLPDPIHQLVGADAAGTQVLALTLGTDDNRPTFLRVDLATGEIEDIGYHNGLYHAALRSPAGGPSVISVEDNAGQSGWFLFLADGQGKWLRDLVKRSQADLLPTWRPDGGEIAYLAQVAP